MNSIRWRLTIRLVAGCTVLWAACGLGIYLTVRARLVGEFDRALLAKAQALGTLTEQQDRGEISLNLADEWMPQFANKKSADFFQLWNAQGRTVERSDSLQGRNLPMHAGTRESAMYWDIPLPDQEMGRAVGIRFTPQPDEDDKRRRSALRPAAEAVLVVAGSRARLDHFLALLQTLLLGSEAAVFLGTATLATWVVRRGLAPLDIVAERAQAIDADAPGTRFPTADMPAELLPICVRLNDSLVRLEASFERERRFSSDAAHELRTPIAELRSLSEVALKWPQDAEASSEALRDALEIALQMEAVVTRLLALMRCESGAQPIQRMTLDVSEIIRRSWQPLDEAAKAKRLQVAFDLPAELRMESDPALLLGIFGNLLGNAAAHTPSGGSIAVSLQRVGDVFAATVVNQPADLSEQDLPHLFERYWRKDSARHDSAHSGLGLPLARAFAEASGMQLSATLPAPDTLQMTLRAAPRQPSGSGEGKSSDRPFRAGAIRGEKHL